MENQVVVFVASAAVFVEVTNFIGYLVQSQIQRVTFSVWFTGMQCSLLNALIKLPIVLINLHKPVRSIQESCQRQ